MGEMTRVAEHINSRKRKYDAAVHVQEVQSLLHDWEVRTWEELEDEGEVPVACGRGGVKILEEEGV